MYRMMFPHWWFPPHDRELEAHLREEEDGFFYMYVTFYLSHDDCYTTREAIRYAWHSHFNMLLAEVDFNCHDIGINGIKTPEELADISFAYYEQLRPMFFKLFHYYHTLPLDYYIADVSTSFHPQGRLVEIQVLACEPTTT